MADNSTEVRYGVEIPAVAVPTERDWQTEQKRIIARTSGSTIVDGKLVHIPGSTPDAVFSDANAGESVKRLHRSRQEMQDMLRDMRYFPWSIVFPCDYGHGPKADEAFDDIAQYLARQNQKKIRRVHLRFFLVEDASAFFLPSGQPTSSAVSMKGR